MGTSSVPGGYQPDPRFLTHHALRIKGFATSATLAEIAALAVTTVEDNLRSLAQSGFAQFREARELWQLTPDGREAHRQHLAEDVKSLDVSSLVPHYSNFLGLNDEFKHLCGDWQLRDGQPNDHADSAYDSSVLGRLEDLHHRASPVIDGMVGVVPRLGPYVPRLSAVCAKVLQGSHNLFTGVMCGSFHDVWMELHEDLILTQGIDRASEGSF